jgi:23S rRNA pseudouridine1911/1915/1917 synthase
MTSPDFEPLRLDVPRRLAGTRFDRALAELVPDRSRSQLQQLVRRGRVKVDGRKVVRSNFRLAGGERVLVHLSDPSAPARARLAFLHVAAELAVLDKPAGMIVQPVAGHGGASVSELLVERFGPLPSVADEARPGIVHRLDRATSGVLVIARTAAALDGLREQFRARTVEKRYLAVVHGVPADDAFDVDRALAPVPGDKDRQRVDARGRPAFTAVRVVRRLREAALVECRPTTGRRHQLRVHLASVGLPIVGDAVYRPSGQRPARGERLGLHALSLAFDDPRTGERLRFEAPPPDAFDELVAARA